MQGTLRQKINGLSKEYNKKPQEFMCKLTQLNDPRIFIPNKIRDNQFGQLSNLIKYWKHNEKWNKVHDNPGMQSQDQNVLKALHSFADTHKDSSLWCTLELDYDNRKYTVEPLKSDEIWMVCESIIRNL